jgi:hypothetical protein
VLVVEGAGFEVAAEDADERVGELAEGGVVALAAAAEGVATPTFRFSESRRPLEPSGTENFVSSFCPNNGCSELTKIILTAVPYVIIASPHPSGSHQPL